MSHPVLCLRCKQGPQKCDDPGRDLFSAQIRARQPSLHAALSAHPADPLVAVLCLASIHRARIFERLTA